MKRTMALLSVVCLCLQVPTRADLISYYDFEEPNPFDDKITGAVATVGVNVTIESGTPFGNAGAFPDGAATDNDIRVAQANAPVIGSNDFTCMVWIKRTDGSSSTADGITDMVANTNEGGFQLLFAPVDLFTLGVGGPGGQWLVHRVTSPVQDTDWHHLAVSVDRDNPSGVLMYIDGVLNATLNATPFESVFIAANQDYQIGSTNDFNLNGLLDELAIFGTVLTAEEIRKAMRGIGSPPELAANPSPDDATIDVPRDVVLTWTAGDSAVTHDVYFGTVLDDVNDASRVNPLGVLLSQGQIETACDPTRLDFSQTYYWRVDEVNGTPDDTIFKGAVWSFTVEPFAYPVTDVTATSNGISEEGTGPENTVNGSGLNAEDQHSTESDDMWLARPAEGEPLQITYAFDAVYKLHEMLVWNYNVQFELLLGFGIKNATIEYSENGTDWSVLGDFDLNQATATEIYTANTVIDFGGVAAQYVRVTVGSGYGQTGQYGLSEVRFTYIPVEAREPEPVNGATAVSVGTALRWRAGREADVHEVHLGADPVALPLVDTVDVSTYMPGPLNLGTTYYWQITEVNEAEAISVWPGDVWSFTAQPYLVVDDFESYRDDPEESRIYNVWDDGWVNETGSTVGHLEAPFAETTIVHSGDQSMPLYYDNTSTSVSEADYTLSQNWTTNGVKRLALFVYGEPDNTGQLYVKINGTKVTYDGPAANITEPSWQPWSIDLSTLGISLTNVTELTIGIEGSGATGLLYIDDIRLYPETLQ